MPPTRPSITCRHLSSNSSTVRSWKGHALILLAPQHQKCSAVPKTQSLLTETQFGAPALSEAKSLDTLWNTVSSLGTQAMSLDT